MTIYCQSIRIRLLSPNQIYTGKLTYFVCVKKYIELYIIYIPIYAYICIYKLIIIITV